VKRLPLYDETAVIACTIGDDEKPERIATLEQMRTDHTSLERTEHGLLLTFPIRAEDLVRRFTFDEKRCCAFFGFEVSRSDDVVTLRWDAPPGASAIVDDLHAFFEGDAPASSLSGLL
jgi:hypothetical protein